MSLMIKDKTGEIVKVAGNSGGGASDADKVKYDNVTSSLEATNVQSAVDELAEKKADKTEILPTYTLAEYEEIKDTIPVGTKFAISDDEGGDDPTPSPSSSGLVEWFVIDETHSITFGENAPSYRMPAVGSIAQDAYVWTICSGIVNPSTKILTLFTFYYNNFTTDSSKISSGSYTSSGKTILVGFLKSDVELCNIQQITL